MARQGSAAHGIRKIIEYPLVYALPEPEFDFIRTNRNVGFDSNLNILILFYRIQYLWF